MGDEGHAGLNEDVGAGLTAPWATRCLADVLIGGEEGDDGLHASERMGEDIADVRAGASADLDEFDPFEGFEPDGAQPVVQSGVCLGVMAVDDHDRPAVRDRGGVPVAWRRGWGGLCRRRAGGAGDELVRYLGDGGLRVPVAPGGGLGWGVQVNVYRPDHPPRDDLTLKEDVASLAARADDVFHDPVPALTLFHQADEPYPGSRPAVEALSLGHGNSNFV